MPSAKTSFLDKVLDRIGRLDKEGLQTVVERLARERSFLETLFNAIEDGVLVVDEAGLLSHRQMLSLTEWVASKQGRLLLVGDTRQHTSVEAGDALRVLEQHSALQTIALRQIQRQVDHEYRAAISDLSEGHGSRAVNRLKQIGAVEDAEGEAEFPAFTAAE